ncbi:MAG: lipoyl synthase [Candidatus Diapherotrites archaeon]|uniref:Lipoyl synthase n=1 Tax=Candidatus Iainarchaeum sp. TaxID=3101447 RepID=A0A8T4C6W4_9ARCH|nr:lipoyl synthase [Candidatus Diapherotrites archaeon]
MEAVQKPRIRPPSSEQFSQLKVLTNNLALHTVCQEAHCPNQSECWSGGTATFMVLGKTCTRGCKFCQIDASLKGDAVDESEPQKLVQAAKQMKLNYVVITMVNRDDLPDQGASHVAKCISALKENNFRVEALVGDFRGDEKLVDVIIDAKPDVFAHNIETVKSLQKKVRDHRASYEQTLTVLQYARSRGMNYTKSSIQLGHGETDEEVLQTMNDLRSAGVNMLTLGQYLQPSNWHLPVQNFASQEKFDFFKREATKMGFDFVASGALVRSSYKAGELFVEKKIDAHIN